MNIPKFKIFCGGILLLSQVLIGGITGTDFLELTGENYHGTGIGLYENFLYYNGENGALRGGRAGGTDNILPPYLGNYSVGYGYNNKASGNGSVALGYHGNSTATASTTIGYSNDAWGNYSFAAGFNSEASDAYTFTMGNNLTTNGMYQFVIGKRNDSTTWLNYDFNGDGNVDNDPAAGLFIIGNGGFYYGGDNGDLYTGSSSNAFIVYEDGTSRSWGNSIVEKNLDVKEDAKILGDLTVNGTISGDGSSLFNGNIQSSGSHVGIGTGSPVSPLEVVGGSSGTESSLLQIRSAYTGTGTASALRFVNSTNATGNYGAAEVSAVRTNDPSSGASNLVFRVSPSGSTMSEVLRIKSDEISTQSNLKVAGDIILGGLAGGGDRRLFLTSDTDAHYIRSNNWWTEFVDHPNQGWRFISDNGSNPIDRVTINASDHGSGDPVMEIHGDLITSVPARGGVSMGNFSN